MDIDSQTAEPEIVTDAQRLKMLQRVEHFRRIAIGARSGLEQLIRESETLHRELSGTKS